MIQERLHSKVNISYKCEKNQNQSSQLYLEDTNQQMIATNKKLQALYIHQVLKLQTSREMF